MGDGRRCSGEKLVGPATAGAPQAEALGCAREGIPVLPWKQKLRRERGDQAGH